MLALLLKPILHPGSAAKRLPAECGEANHPPPSISSLRLPQDAHVALTDSVAHSGSVWFIESNQNCSEISSPMTMHTFKPLFLRLRPSPEAKLSHAEQILSGACLPSLVGDPYSFSQLTCSLVSPQTRMKLRQLTLNNLLNVKICFLKRQRARKSGNALPLGTGVGKHEHLMISFHYKCPTPKPSRKHSSPKIQKKITP